MKEAEDTTIREEAELILKQLHDYYNSVYNGIYPAEDAVDGAKALNLIMALLTAKTTEAHERGFALGQQDIVQNYHHDPEIRRAIKAATLKATSPDTTAAGNDLVTTSPNTNGGPSNPPSGSQLQEDI